MKRVFFRLLMFFTLALQISFLQLQAQERYPKDYFRSPLDIPLALSGNFGELRSNHFHSGLDFKTGGVEGKQVFAAADGYVSRIKISAYGYGYAIYITHPNGFTTLYGHLQSYQGEIATYVRNRQRTLERFEVDLYLYPKELPVKKGQVIALSGNSGSSGGPHLHFEIRDSKTEEIINPEFFGFNILDDVPPLISAINLYPYHEASRINHSVRNQRFVAIAKDGKYTLGNQLPLVAGPFLLGIATFDKHNNNHNFNGVYSINVKENGKSVFYVRFDRFEFAESRYANAFMDYDLKQRTGQYVFICRKSTGNNFQKGTAGATNYIANVTPDSVYDYEITVADAKGNTSTINFKVRGGNPAPQIESSTARNMDLKYPQIKNFFSGDGLKLEFPLGCFYDTLDFEHSVETKSENPFSDIHKIHHYTTPVHLYYGISMRGTVPDSLKPFTLLVSEQKKGQKSFIKGSWSGNNFNARTRAFGTYYLDIDTVPPKITALNIAEMSEFKAGQSIRIRIGDNKSGVDYYRAEINGTWFLMEFDGKSGTLKGLIESSLPNGTHSFSLIVRDVIGNTSRLNLKFVKK